MNPNELSNILRHLLFLIKVLSPVFGLFGTELALALFLKNIFILRPQLEILLGYKTKSLGWLKSHAPFV